MYNLDLKCSTKETIPNCSIWDHRHTFAIWKSLRPAFNSELASCGAENVQWGQSPGLLLFIPAKIHLLTLAGSRLQLATNVPIARVHEKKNTPNNYMCTFSLSLFCRTHETLFLCVAHIYWCLVLLCAPVSLLLSTFARLQNEVVISKTHIVKIWTCPYCPFLLTASHQGVPGPGQYDIRRQCEPHGSRCSFLSQAEVCKCTAHSFLSPATNKVSKSGMVWLHFHFSVCVKILCPVFVKELEKICSLAESCSTDVERIISTHMTS